MGSTCFLWMTEATQSASQRGGGGGRQGPPPLPNPKTTCTGQRLNQGAFNIARDQFNTMCDQAKVYDAYHAQVLTYDGVMSYVSLPKDVSRLSELLLLSYRRSWARRGRARAGGGGARGGGGGATGRGG